MITIWGRLNSHNVKKVVWAAIEAGIEWQRIDMGGAHGFTPDYLAMNPNRMIPSITDDAVPGGFSLWESNAILRYLAQAYAPALWPADPVERARGDKWMDWQFHFADAQRDAFIGLVRHSPEDRDHAAVARSAAEAARLMTILDAELAMRPWLSGAAFGIADIPMGVYAHTWFTLAMPRPDLPHLADWHARLSARPGYADYVAIALT